MNLSDRPVRITDDLVFLGEVPRWYKFEETEPEARRIRLPDGRAEPDLLFDDSAPAFCSGSGLVIVTGCSHTGICSITGYAREVCGQGRVAAIIGGLHLIAPSPSRLAGTGEYLQALGLQALYLCHCTDLASNIALAGYCPVQDVGCGLRLVWERGDPSRTVPYHPVT